VASEGGELPPPQMALAAGGKEGAAAVGEPSAIFGALCRVLARHASAIAGARTGLGELAVAGRGRRRGCLARTSAALELFFQSCSSAKHTLRYG
jgi:hypothetical protein